MPLPHVAIIMDGNGRWAQSRGLSRVEGHLEGVNTIKHVIKAAVARNLPILTLFAFSSENRSRPPSEVGFLFNLLHKYFDENLKLLAADGVCLQIIGEVDGLNKETLDLLAHVQEATRDNKKMILQIAFNYGSHEEIVHAARKIATLARDEKLDPADITREVFEAHLRTAGLPNPDLIIRTSGEYRLSNFMLWQAAYSELYFTDVCWPDFTEHDLDLALKAYAGRERRFGKVREADETAAKPGKRLISKIMLQKAGK